MSISQLYVIWLIRIWERRPAERTTRVRNLAWLITDIFQNRSIHLRRVATKIASNVQLLSVERRVSRLLDNPALHVREGYAPLARDWLDWGVLTNLRKPKQ